jgi:hypothetical protein
VSAKWKAADEKTKAEYEEKARLDKERYLKEKAEYEGSVGKSSGSSKPKKRAGGEGRKRAEAEYECVLHLLK